jgi:catechol 2,3-dioxygenase-like lactoylglutathione lyase family enzyme
MTAVTGSLRCELFPDDLDVAVAFYTGVLGFAVVRDERSAPAPYVALRRGDVHLGLAARPAPADVSPRRPPTGVELVLEVDDLAADHARVRATGWPLAEDLTDRPWGLRDFRLLDPHGYYWRVTTRA